MSSSILGTHRSMWSATLPLRPTAHTFSASSSADMTFAGAIHDSSLRKCSRLPKAVDCAQNTSAAPFVFLSPLDHSSANLHPPLRAHPSSTSSATSRTDTRARERAG